MVSSQSTLRAAATSGASYLFTSQRRHQYPDRGPLARRLEPALPLRPEHRQHLTPIGRDLDPRLRSIRLLCNPALLQRSIHRTHDAGSRRTLNYSDEGGPEGAAENDQGDSEPAHRGGQPSSFGRNFAEEIMAVDGIDIGWLGGAFPASSSILISLLRSTG
jgi:hypothetical protein